MTLQISFQHIDATDALKAFIEKKSEKLAKYFNGRINVVWHLSVERQQQIAHCHLVGNHMDFYGDATTSDLYASIEQAVAKVERQIRKHKEVVKDHLHRHAHRSAATG